MTVKVKLQLKVKHKQRHRHTYLLAGCVGGWGGGARGVNAFTKAQMCTYSHAVGKAQPAGALAAHI